MRGVDPDEVAAQGGTRSCGRNMVRVRILRMPRIEVEIHRKAVKPLNSRDVLSRACVRTMPKAPANRPQTPFFGFSRKYHEVEKTPLEKNEKVLLEYQWLMARGRTPPNRQSFRGCPNVISFCLLMGCKGRFDGACGRLPVWERIGKTRQIALSGTCKSPTFCVGIKPLREQFSEPWRSSEP